MLPSENPDQYTSDFIPFWSDCEADWERFIPQNTPPEIVEWWREQIETNPGGWGKIMRGEVKPLTEAALKKMRKRKR